MKEIRDIERNLFKSGRVIIEIEEVRKDERNRFVPIGEKKLVLKLSEKEYLSIGRSRGEYEGEESYPVRPVRTEKGKEIYVDYVYVRIGNRREISPVKVGRLNMMGRYDVPKEEIGDSMSVYQVEIYISKMIGEKWYLAAIRNVGKRGQEIKVYDEKGNKIDSIPPGEELILRGGTYFIELPGRYLPKDRDLVENNGFLKITLS